MNCAIDYISVLTEELGLDHYRAHSVLILTDAIFLTKLNQKLANEWPVWTERHGPLYRTAANAIFENAYYYNKKFTNTEKLPTKERNVLEFVAQHTKNISRQRLWQMIKSPSGGVVIPGLCVALSGVFDEFKSQSPDGVLFIERLLSDYPP